jgi:hypothetical protein
MACENKLTVEEQAAAQANFTYWQAEYNKTGDKMIVWDKLMPIFKDALGPAILKMNNFHFVQNYETKLDDATLTLVTRYLKNQNYSYNSLATLCYWAALAVCRKQSVIDEEKYCLAKCSFEDLFTENENGDPIEHYEHIIKTF